MQSLPGAEALLVDRLAAAATGRRGAATVAVVGGRGGAGASTLACALARDGGSSAGAVMLVDADPLGGGLDLLLGAEGVPGLRWPDLAEARGRAARASCAPPCPASTASRCCPGTAATRRAAGEADGRRARAPGAAATTSSCVDLPRSLGRGGGRGVRRPTGAAGRAGRGPGGGGRRPGRRPRLAVGVADLRVVVRGPSPARLSGRLVAGELGLPLAGWLRAGARAGGRPGARRAAGPVRPRPAGAALPRRCSPTSAGRRPGGWRDPRRPALVARVTERLALAGEAPTGSGGDGRGAARGRGARRPGGAGAGRPRSAPSSPASARSRPLLADAEVSDVLVNGPGEVWVDRGAGVARGGRPFRDEAAVRRLAQRLAASAGRRLDVARPTVDARLAGGVRLHAVLPPVSPGRDPDQPAGRPAAHLHAGRAGRPRHRRAAARRASSSGWSRPGSSFLVTGGTGTGKTTLLATLLSRVPPDERRRPGRGLRRARARPSARRPARGAHRQRRGRRAPSTCAPWSARRCGCGRTGIVVGEVRGGEVVELLAALNTGHDGGAGTVHASAAAALPARLEALALAAGLPREALHSQLAGGVQVVVHLAREPDGGTRGA